MHKIKTVKQTVAAIVELVKETFALYPKRILIAGLILPSFIIYLAGLYFPLVILQIYDRIIPNAAVETLFVLIVTALFVSLIDGTLKYIRIYFTTIIQIRHLHQSRSELFTRCMNAQTNEFQQISLGAYLGTFQALEKLKKEVGMSFMLLSLDVPFLLFFIAIIYYFNPYLIIVPITMSIVMVIVLFKTRENLDKHQIMQNHYQAEETSILFSLFKDKTQIKSLNTEEVVLTKHAQVHQDRILNQAELNKNTGKISDASHLTSNLNVIFIVSLGCILVISEQTTMGILTAAMILSSRITEVIQRFISTWNQYESLIIAQDELNDIMDIPLEHHTTTLKIDEMDSQEPIIFKNIYYEDEHGPILTNINVEIPFGKTVLIECKVAIAKGILLKMLLQEISPTNGKIYYGKSAIDLFSVDEYRSKISYLNRKGILYNGTILQNLTNFSEDPKAIKYAKQLVKQFNCWEKIMQMPKAFDTEINMNSQNEISKGLKQIICITRALITEPKIILFDEASSALDLATDSLLRDVFEKIKGHATIFLVSHKPAMYTLADMKLTIQNQDITLEDCSNE